jgi:putative transcriptional regulator
MNNGYEKLKNIREKNSISYEDMAKKLGISKSFYWQLENRKRRLYYDMAKKIAKVFKVKPDDLFYED